jgi:membrane protease YdiL (CAAX protease family)
MASFSAAKQSSEREHDRGAKFTTRNQILAGLLFAFGFPMLPMSRWEHEFAGVGHLVAYDVIWWAAVAVTLLYVHFVERRPLTSIGFRAITWRGIAIAIGAAAVMIGGLAFIYYVIFPVFHMDESSEIHTLLSTPLWWLVISTVRAGVSEEVLYRGYAMERLGELAGSRTLAGAVSWALFAFAHVGPWGWPHLLVAGFGGAVLTVLYLWRGNLWVNILTHIIVDGVGVLAG